jgi:cyclic pyranopterin phosphate synthase
MMEKLVDAYGREIRSLRFAVTKRCNLNCIYCHNEGEEKEEITDKDKEGGRNEISVEKISSIARVAASYFDVGKVKFSGGEPLMRGDFVDIISGLKELSLDEVSLTTNGTLLGKYAYDLADAGLNRVNISLDSLNETKYDFITRSKHNLSRVFDGVHSAIDANLTPIKLNLVVLKGINDGEIYEMMDFVRTHNKNRGKDKSTLILQLIELMDFWGESDLAPYKVDFSVIERMLASKANRVEEREMQKRRKYIIGSEDDANKKVEVEVVHPIDNTEFCMHCNRLRITTDGKIKPCLLRNDNLVEIESMEEAHIIKKMKEAMRFREPFYQHGFSKT